MCNLISSYSTSLPQQTCLSAASLSYSQVVRYTIFVLATLSSVSFIIATVALGCTSWPILVSLILVSILFFSIFVAAKLFLSCKALTPAPLTPEPVYPQVPAYSDLSFHTIGNMLKQDFKKTSEGSIFSHTRSVTLKRDDQLLLHFQQGHPFDDPFLSPKDSSILLPTNSSANLSLSIGRTLAVAGSLNKENWEDITSQGVTIGHCVSGIWKSSSPHHSSPRARALILINPPTIETLIPDDIRKGLKRDVTLEDFSLTDSFRKLLFTYLRIFKSCRTMGTSSLQLEILGVHDLSSTHTQFPQWEALCHSALLAALRSDQSSGETPLRSITINSQKELPMKKALTYAFK